MKLSRSHLYVILCVLAEEALNADRHLSIDGDTHRTIHLRSSQLLYSLVGVFQHHEQLEIAFYLIGHLAKCWNIGRKGKECCALSLMFTQEKRRENPASR